MLFDNEERYLLKKNKRFVLNSKDYMREDTSEEEGNSIKHLNITSPRIKWLL